MNVVDQQYQLRDENEQCGATYGEMLLFQHCTFTHFKKYRIQREHVNHCLVINNTKTKNAVPIRWQLFCVNYANRSSNTVS